MIPTIVFSGSVLSSSSSDNYQWFFNGDSILNANTINYIPLQSGGYSVQITDGLGCSSISAEMNVVITNVEYHSNPFKNIQPNPFKESTTILFGENVKGEYELLIYDIVVKEVFRLNNITENKVVINKEDIDKGLFLIYSIQRIRLNRQKRGY